MANNKGFTRLPPLSALRGFEAAARLNSFSKASDELHMTQSAISHQVKLLEEYFGQPLFKRVNRTVEVTDAGLDFLKTVQVVLAQLQKGTNRLNFFNKPGLVVLTTSPAFADKWLMSKLPQFKHDNPDLDAWIYTNYEQQPLEHAEIDLAVWYGSGDWPGVEVIKLFDDYVTPLYSPNLLPEGTTIDKPQDLADYPLIHVEQMERREDWGDWFVRAGVDDLSSATGYNFNDAGLALDHAVQGQGIVLGSVTLAKDLIASGKLVRPFECALETEFTYYLVYRPDKKNNANVERLRRWLLEKVGLPVTDDEALAND